MRERVSVSENNQPTNQRESNVESVVVRVQISANFEGQGGVVVIALNAFTFVVSIALNTHIVRVSISVG